jgi:hypothetical protein
VTVEHRSHLIEECHRQAAEARRSADTQGVSLMRATMITADPRPMSSAPLDGTPVRLFASLGSAIASFWTAERSRKAFGAGDYRAGWFLLDDEAVELNNPMGWEPLTHEIDR